MVATGGSEGTDTLSAVEKIDGAGTHNILLVGNGGYATIQAAVNAAADGDTIEIAAGTYTENVTITGKALTIDGVETGGGVNSVTLNGQITVAGTLNGAFAITDLNIDATGKDYGVLVSANSTGFAGSVTLDDVSISNAQQDGFAYVRTGNGSTPTLGDTIGAVSILNSQFHNNATANIPAGGRADILLFGYNHDLTITNVVIDTPGAFAQKAIQMRGIEDPGNVVNVGPYHEAGDVAINNLTISGAYGQDVMAFYRIAGFDSFTGSNNSVNVTRAASASSNATLEPWAVINMDEVGGSVDLSSFFTSASNLASANGGPGVPSWIATLQGLGGNEIFIGTSGTDTLVGRGGNDILNGGAGADTMQGGAGNDTYLVDNVGDVVMENASEGNDLVQSSVSFTLGANVDNLTLTGSADINGTGNGDANVITGNSGNNTLDGGAGADTLSGGNGNDTYVVDNAGDLVTEAATVGSGTDTVQSSISYTLGTNVENLTLTGSGNINGTGNGDANVITGNTGNNILTGGGGNDTLVGGAGTDTASYTGTLTRASITAVADIDAVTPGNQAGWQVVASGGQGTDTLSGVEKVTDGAGHNFLLVGNGGFATIQAAVDAAVAGDTIMIAAGVYSGNVIVNKQLTILGAHAGVDASDASRDLAGGVGESTLSGLLQIGGAGVGVVIDGMRILNGAKTGATGSDTPGIFVQSSDVLVTHSVFFRDGVVDGDQSRGIMTSSGANGLVVTDNVMTGWHTGVYVNGGQTTEGVTVTDNIFEGNLVGLSMDAFPGGQPITVTDNHFIANLLEGVGIGSGAGGASWSVSSTVSGNTFEGPAIFNHDANLPVSILNGNTLVGSAGDDTLLATASPYNDIVDGLGGTDTYDLTGAGAGIVNLAAGTASSPGGGSDTLASIENVTGGSGNDINHRRRRQRHHRRRRGH